MYHRMSMILILLDYTARAIALALISFLVANRHRNRRNKGGTPVLGSLFLGFGTGFAFHSRRTTFLEECGKRYGSYFKFACGPRNIHIVSSSSAFKTFYFDSRLDHKEPHFLVLRALGSSGNIDLLSTPVHEHFIPYFGRALSRRGIAQEITHPLYIELRQRFREIQPQPHHKLSDLIGKTLYYTCTAIIFGPSFPLDTYDDFIAMDLAMPMLISPLAFMAFSGARARGRLLKVMMNYVQENGDFAGEKVAIVSSALRSAHVLPLREQGACLLSLLWSIHSNLLRSIWWMLAYFAVDTETRHRLKAEILATVPENCETDLESLLVLDPDSMFRQFPLLDSAITETIRLCSLPGSMRVAVGDIEIPLDDGGTFSAFQGEMVMTDTRAHHMRDDLYPDAKTFRADRFLPRKDGTLDVPKIMSWGGGAHVCKGKAFAHHVMKVWAVAFLQTYDFTTADILPDLDPRSGNVIADPSKDINIKLEPRYQTSD
ncbi:Cytochrome P450 [Mycena venus]|uniref:Cytochrome P450 n=1 Tax=Mycena venus TaxID=2733690 RepID=A0A8H6WRH7_9AGAR|nr:Cytochrome P450 [Mycena venus]